MGRIQFYNNGEVFNSIVYFLQFLMSTSNQIVSINIPAINIEQCMTIFNSIHELAFLHVGAGANKECFFMVGVGFEFETADTN